MGTRSLTRVFDGDKEIACIYRQFDGYRTGHGKALADFILSRPFVNGISGSREVFNGMGCFAAQLIGHLKGDQAGAIYLYAPGTSDVWEEYVYEVRGGLDENHEPLPVTVSCVGSESFPAGAPEAFKAWCEAEEVEAA
jgi:hypothetical protein